ncbi:signal transduction histidine kinase [Novosphingobium sp. Rr 2-17]|uniref:sensor histidine kinase n=1 Tax=Novosphingobium sp. Rr 2-17 TaxID=555793 RepID=UPI000269AAC8|nr:histidine kinase dimerization/phosphoacceptor domain -containing protein [Novosphingobium sp. Rr 2-17]EIZ81366.1 signal transduction histidine kinase [Novosphingobium sp. Rr 2-17]
MEFFTPVPSESAHSLGSAIVQSSITPLLLLNDQLIVQAASDTFCSTFGLHANAVVGNDMFMLGGGEWDILQLRSLLMATLSGDAAIDAYELVLRRRTGDLHLVLSARLLDYAGDETRLILSVTDATAIRLSEQQNSDLIREKMVLLQELQHRVANSLQIIASVLMQSARRVQSDEARTHLNNAHHRVMSIATLQKQLATRSDADVALRPYFVDLCASIGASMISDPAHLTIKTAIDEATTTADVSVSLGLIVTELVINALKHAFPDKGHNGLITVSYVTEGNGWTLSVGDNGVGMPGGEAKSEPGLGTGIVEALSKQLGAEVEIQNSQPGTMVSIVQRGQPAL